MGDKVKCPVCGEAGGLRALYSEVVGYDLNDAGEPSGEPEVLSEGGELLLVECVHCGENSDGADYAQWAGLPK